MCSVFILSERKREGEWGEDKARLSAWLALYLKGAMWQYAEREGKKGRSVMKQACFRLAKGAK